MPIIFRNFNFNENERDCNYSFDNKMCTEMHILLECDNVTGVKHIEFFCKMIFTYSTQLQDLNIAIEQ